jgi:GNAT superfamily N-acetyltransferase
MTITIEAAVSTDIEPLVELLTVLFSIEKDFQPNPEAQRLGLSMLLDRKDLGQILVARHATLGVVGMISIQLVISTAVGAPSAWIEDVVLQEAFRGQGVGLSLLESAKNWAKDKGARRVQLLADADNTPALEFYKKHAWQPTRLFAWKQQLI